MPLEAVELPAAAAELRPSRSPSICSSDALRARLPRLRAGPTATSCAPSAGASTTRPTSSPTRADEDDLRRLLEWCEEAGAAAIPYGGGTSVVGGVEPRRRRRLRGRGVARPAPARPRARGRPASRARRGSRRARPGPASRSSCASHGLTLRHFPQSFEFSTLGGWIATRAGGHFATLYTHIDDLVESVRTVTPRGVWEIAAAARLGRRAEPRPAAARLRGDPRRDHRGVGARAGRGPRSARRRACASRASQQGAAAARALSQSGLYPDELPPARPRRGARSRARRRRARRCCVLGFESADHPLEPWMERALEICARSRRRAGRAAQVQARGRGGGARRRRGAWRDAFLAGAVPARHAGRRRGARPTRSRPRCTWDRFDEFVATVRRAGAAGRCTRSAGRAA